MALPPFRISRLDFTPTPQPSWADCIYAQSIDVFLAVSPQANGTADKVLRSGDGGVTWTEEDLPTGANWGALVWSEEAELFACFCTNNSGISVATSPDGITWSNAHAEQALIRSCVYGQNKFVGVGGQQNVVGINVISKSNFALQANGVATRTVNINMSVSTTMFVGIVGATNDYVDGGGAGVTFNGVAMTLLQKVQVSGDRWIYLFHLQNPSVGGTFALTVTFNTTNNGTTVTNVGSAIYITGYSNAGAVSSSTTDTGSGTSISTSRPIAENGEWLLQFSCNAADSTATAGSSTTVRQTTDGQGGAMADSNGPKSPPTGPFSIAVNVTSSNWAAITVAFAPRHREGLITSADGGTWVESYIANETLQAVAYSPSLDLFCAIAGAPVNGGGNGATFCILTSPDAVTWTYRDLGSSAGADLSASGSCTIVWSDVLELFCVVLADGNVRTSADGITWQQLTLPVDPAVPMILGVTWAPAPLEAFIFFTEADSPGYKQLLYSEDGVDIVPVDRVATEDTDGDWSCGAYAPTHDRMIVFPTFNDYAMTVEFGPDLIEVDPPQGEVIGGNTVNLIGTGFFDGMEAVFDNRFATDVNVISETLATCVVPAHASGFVTVTVTNPDDRYDEEPLIYEYVEPTDPATGEPEIIPQIGWMGSGCAPGSIVPDHGTMAGGTPFTLYGQGFKAGSTVLFGGTPATSVFIDAEQPWPALVLAKLPDAWWRLEEESAALVLVDEMGNHDATMSSATGKTSVRGGLSYSATKGIALDGGSTGFAFDGSQGIASFAGLETLLSGACTIEFFLKPIGISGYGTIIGASIDQDGIYYFNNGQNFISYESAAHGYADQTNTNPLVTGQTYHIALVFDGLGAAQWVIDGVADAAVPDVNLAGLLDCLFDTGGFQLRTDLVDEIAVYDTALSIPTLLNHSDNRGLGYPALVLADGAIAYWRCGEANDATTLADTAGNGHDATQSVGGRTSVPGALSDAHTYAVPAPGVNLSGSYSIEFLLNPTDVAALQVLLASIGGLGFLLETDRTLRATVAHTVVSDTPLAAGAISHVVFTASGSVGKWFINGVEHGTGTWDGTDDVTLLRMFAGTSDVNPLACNVIDEIVVHSVELTAAEVLAHYVAARTWISGTYITGITPPHQTGPVDVEVISP